jgi:hypothetical protein
VRISGRRSELPEINFDAEASGALECLEDAVVEYQGREGTVNQPLIDARQAVALLQAQLDEALAQLKEVEARGSWLDHFDVAVYAAERSVEALLRNYERKVTDEWIKARFGQAVNPAALDPDTKRELRLHSD